MRRNCNIDRPGGAFTMVEVLVSMVIVSVMLIAALNAVGAARTGEALVSVRARALLLAQQLLDEILQQSYADPLAGSTSFGRESGEDSTSRAQYDDVDDYNGWQASPPQYKDGSVIPASNGYGQAVVVVNVQPNNLQGTSLTPTGIKRIEVTIQYQGRPIVTLRAHRTIDWGDFGTIPESRY